MEIKNSIRCLLYLAFYFISFSAFSLTLDNLNIDLMPDKKVRYVTIHNSSPQKNLYTVSMVQVAVPRQSGQETIISDGSLLYSPQKLELNPGQRAGFKFYYMGKTDNIERYYRVKFTETPITTMKWTARKREISSDFRLAVEAIMIVRPAKIAFSYKINKNEIINTGNTYFKYMSSVGCSNNYLDSKFVAPGETFLINKNSSRSKKILVFRDKIIKLTSCSK